MSVPPVPPTPISPARSGEGAPFTTWTLAPRRRGGLPILEATLAENRAGIAIACFYILAVVLLVGALVPAVKTVNLAGMFSSSVGKALLGSSISAGALQTFTGYLSVEFYSVWFGLFFGGYLAFIAGSIVARPIDDGTIELLLARPFSRRRFYLERCAAIGMVGLVMSLWTLASVWLASRIFAGTDVDWHWLLLTQLAGGAFLLLTLGLGVVISAGTSNARTAGSAAIGVLVLGYLLNSLATLSARLSWMAYLSPFHYAPLNTILVNHQITWWNLLLLSGLGVAGVLAGLLVFERRDLT